MPRWCSSWHATLPTLPKPCTTAVASFGCTRDARGIGDVAFDDGDAEIAQRAGLAPRTRERPHLIAAGPLFTLPQHHAQLTFPGVLACVLCGLLAAGLSGLLTLSVYAFEDLFEKLPIHWMWWPAIGGLVIGVGGLIYPHALGVVPVQRLLHPG